jgi:transcriptional regulator
MFLPKHFTESDATAIAALVRAAGFGHLVVAGGGGLSSTPMPFVIDDELSAVRAHLARPNPIWSMAPCDALLIVPVSDAYISPGWYPSKQVDGKVVPTWNYEVVHLHGRLVSHDDPEWVYAQITELTELNESALDAPWAVTDAPADYITKLQGSIVGVELEVTRVDAKRKLSQNKSDTDRSGAIEGLANSPLARSAAVGRAMS